MSSPWAITARPGTNTQATASQAAPGSGLQNRLRAVQVSIVGTSAGVTLAVVRDGPTVTGTIIAQWDIGCVANGNDRVQLTGLDLRASAGNALTVETTTAGGGSTQISISAQGDLVQSGAPYGFTQN